jgi:hypothetical protein
VVVDTTAVIISAFFDIRLLSWTTRSPAVADKRWVGCRSSCPLLRGPCFCSRRCCSHGLFLASSRQQAELLLAVVIIAELLEPLPSGNQCYPRDAVAWAADGRAGRAS